MNNKVAIGIDGLSQVTGDFVCLFEENSASTPAMQLDSETVVLYAEFASYAARQLAQDSAKSLDTVKLNWLHNAKMLENLVKKYRTQVTLFNTDIAAHNPQTFAQYASNTSLLYKQNIWILLALQFLQQNDDEIRHQEQVLEALETPLAENSQPLSLQLDDLQKAFVSLENNSKKLEAKLEAQQQCLESKHHENEALRKQLDEQAEACNDALAARDKLAEAKQEADKENSLILEQLFKVQEELERYYLAGKESEQQVAKLNAEMERKNKKLHQFSQKIKQLETALDALRGYPETVLELTKPTPAPKNIIGKVKRRIKPLPVKRLNPLQMVKQSPLFDEDYLQQYPDVGQQRCDPALHFLKYCGFEGRNPSRRFNTEWYLKQNPDVGEVDIKPLVHFLMYGAAEGRLACPPHSKTESK